MVGGTQVPPPGLNGGYPHETEQHSKHLLCGKRCASCVHAGGLSCIDSKAMVYSILSVDHLSSLFSDTFFTNKPVRNRNFQPFLCLNPAWNTNS